MIAPEAMVKTAMMAAVMRAEGHQRHRALVGLVALGDTSVPKKTKQPISAPTANRISPR